MAYLTNLFLTTWVFKTIAFCNHLFISNDTIIFNRFTCKELIERVQSLPSNFKVSPFSSVIPSKTSPFHFNLKIWLKDLKAEVIPLKTLAMMKRVTPSREKWNQNEFLLQLKSSLSSDFKLWFFLHRNFFLKNLQ